LDIKETGCEVVDWIQLAQDRTQWLSRVIMVMSLWAPRKADLLTSRVTISFSKKKDFTPWNLLKFVK
jgi:hypothetical protein